MPVGTAKQSRQHPEVFPGGPPLQYKPGPSPLNFGGWKRSGGDRLRAACPTRARSLPELAGSRRSPQLGSCSPLGEWGARPRPSSNSCSAAHGVLQAKLLPGRPIVGCRPPRRGATRPSAGEVIARLAALGPPACARPTGGVRARGASWGVVGKLAGGTVGSAD